MPATARDAARPRPCRRGRAPAKRSQASSAMTRAVIAGAFAASRRRHHEVEALLEPLARTATGLTVGRDEEMSRRERARVLADAEAGGRAPGPGASRVSVRYAARAVATSGRISPAPTPPSRASVAARSADAMPVSAASKAFCAICWWPASASAVIAAAAAASASAPSPDISTSTTTSADPRVAASFTAAAPYCAARRCARRACAGCCRAGRARPRRFCASSSMRSARGTPFHAGSSGADPAVDRRVRIRRVVETDRDLQVRNAAHEFLVLECRPRCRRPAACDATRASRDARSSRCSRRTRSLRGRDVARRRRGRRCRPQPVARRAGWSRVATVPPGPARARSAAWRVTSVSAALGGAPVG